MKQVNNTVKNPNVTIRRTCDLVRTLSSNARSFIINEHRDDNHSLPACNNTISTQEASDAKTVGDLIEEWPSTPIYTEVRDRIDRAKLKQAVKDANNDSMNEVGLVKDGLDITLRAFRVTEAVHFPDEKLAPALPAEDPRWYHATRKDFDVSIASSFSFERRRRKSLDYECVTRSLRSLSMPADQSAVNTKNRRASFTVLEIDNMLLRQLH